LRAHPVWRGVFIYSITCNLTIFVLALFLQGRVLKFDTFPVFCWIVTIIYLFSEAFLLFVSPFFIRRFGGLARWGLILALFNFVTVLSISGRT